MKQSISSKSRRYQGDKLDFIIPFLINHQPSERTLKFTQHSQRSRELSDHHTTSGFSNLDHIARIYNIPKKKSASVKKQNRGKAIQQISTRQPSLHPPNISEIFPQKCVTPQRFMKSKSQMCQKVVPDVSPSRISNLNRKYTKNRRVQPSVAEGTSLMGIKFKNKEQEKKERKAFIKTPYCDETNIQKLQGYVRKKVKQWKQKRQWDRMRGMNVDAIINRKCKIFSEVISQYRRRMGLSEKSKIFVFDSQDLWFKRVLLDRGWVQNTNIDSKAFHLSWSNKIPKESIFQEQCTNHYPNGLYLTTKGGLYTLLKKHELTELIPKTFDLSTQRDIFVREFQKRQLLINLKQFLSQFQFEDPPRLNSRQTLLLKMKHAVDMAIFPETSKLIKYCLALLEEQQLKLNQTKFDFDQLYNMIKGKSSLSEEEQESIRSLSQFSSFVDSQIGLIGGNFWITKSKLSSKGAGITIHNDFKSILKYDNRLVQKYIQKPLIFERSPFRGRKFDLRVWVLLAGNGPQIYYHKKFYGRTCYDSYELNSLNIKSENIHLTNYSQNKKMFIKNNDLQSSTIFPQQLFVCVQWKYGIDYKPKFYADLQNILNKLSHVFRLQIGGKGAFNHFQLFGCDILLDEALNMYLLEINMSASCKERHQKLSIMLQDMGKGILNILQRTDEGEIDTHGWVQIN